MDSVNLLPVDIFEESFKVEGGMQFDPSILDYENPDREKWDSLSSKCLKSHRSVKCQSCEKCRWSFG